MTEVGGEVKGWGKSKQEGYEVAREHLFYQYKSFKCQIV